MSYLDNSKVLSKRTLDFFNSHSSSESKVNGLVKKQRKFLERRRIPTSVVDKQPTHLHEYLLANVSKKGEAVQQQPLFEPTSPSLDLGSAATASAAAI